MSESKNNENNENNENKENTDKLIYIYQNLFVSSVLHVVDSMKKISLENDERIIQEKKQSHENMRKTCDNIINQYKNQSNELDQVKVIKKVFKVLSQHKDLLRQHNVDLFSVRNPDGKILTIIPGLNINLNIALMTEPQMNELWEHIEAMYVASVKMIYIMTDESRHSKDVLELVALFEQNAMKKIQHNFFMGLNTSSDNATIDMEQLMSSDINIPGTEANSGILGSLGIDKLMNPENLANEIKKFDEKDINDTINTLTSMLGNDSDIKDVCSTMVQSVLEDIKTNGIENMFSIAERVSSKIGDKIDPEKMAKTANGMNDLIKNNKDQINNLKDENGNLLGGDLIKQLQSTLNMTNIFKNMSK